MSIPLSLVDVPCYVLVAVPLVVLLAYTIFGATGFGSSMISVPALAHFFPLTFILPLVTAMDVFAATSTSMRLRRWVAWRELLRLLPAMVIGMTLGATLLLNLPPGPALLLLGVFASVYGVYLLLGPRALKRAPAWLAWPVGLAGGVFSVLFGSGGPVYMVFLSARMQDKAALRATSATILTISVWLRIALFTGAGLLLKPALLTLVVLSLPVMAAGLWLGNRLHHALSGRGILRLIAGLLLGNGIALIIRAATLYRG